MKNFQILLKLLKLHSTFNIQCSTRKGFTLIELMVSITVMLIISSAIMVGKSKEEEKMILNMSAFAFTQSLREYQEKALASETAVCPNVPDQVCGFGVHLAEGDDFFTPFIDCSSDCKSSNHTLTGVDTHLPTISFGSKIKICSMTKNNFDIVFAPPDPIVYFNNVDWALGEESIVLCLKKDTSKIKTIKLNHAGKIEIQ